MIIKKKSECNSIFFMILCIMVIVGGMARFSPVRKRRVRGSSRSSGAVLNGVGCNTSRLALGYGGESWACKYTLLLINSE